MQMAGGHFQGRLDRIFAGFSAAIQRDVRTQVPSGDAKIKRQQGQYPIVQMHIGRQLVDW